MGLLDGLKNVKGFSGIRTYPAPGEYVVRINEVKAGMSPKGAYWTTGYTVLTSLPDIDDPERPPNRIGQDVSCTWTPGDYHEAWLNKIKAQIMNISGQEDVGEEHGEEVCGPNQPFAGLVVEILVKRKDKGKDYAECVFLRTLTDDEVAALPDEAKALIS